MLLRPVFDRMLRMNQISINTLLRPVCNWMLLALRPVSNWMLPDVVSRPVWDWMLLIWILATSLDWVLPTISIRK